MLTKEVFLNLMQSLLSCLIFSYYFSQEGKSDEFWWLKEPSRIRHTSGKASVFLYCCSFSRTKQEFKCEVLNGFTEVLFIQNSGNLTSDAN